MVPFQAAILGFPATVNPPAAIILLSNFTMAFTLPSNPSPREFQRLSVENTKHLLLKLIKLLNILFSSSFRFQIFKLLDSRPFFPIFFKKLDHIFCKIFISYYYICSVIFRYS